MLGSDSKAEFRENGNDGGIDAIGELFITHFDTNLVHQYFVVT
jgi:hypothetical protein